MSNNMTITAAALEKLAIATAGGQTIQISDFVVTDSTVDDEATVGNELYTAPISNISVDHFNINTVIVKAVIPSTVNSGATVTKAYLKDSDGDVFAYGLVPPFTLSEDNNIEADINFYVTHTDVSSAITLTVPSQASVTREEYESGLDGKSDSDHNHDERYLQSVSDASETVKGIAKIATNAIVDDINNTSNDTDIMSPDKTRRMIANESLRSLYTLATPVQIFLNQNSLNGANFNNSINIDLTNIDGVDYSNKKYLFLNMYCMANRKSGTGATNTFNLVAEGLSSGFVVINSSSAIETNSIANTMQIVPVNGNTLTVTRSRTGPGTLTCEYYMSITLTGYFE